IARDASEIWLGSAKFGRMTEYVWSDNTSFNFKGWENGKPPVSKYIRPCTKMNVANGEWFQSCCRIVAPYICQKNPQRGELHSSKKNYDTTRTDRKNSTFSERWRFLLRK
ncbi:hypothetical protein LOAG_13274, partial [Loa loa]